MVVICTTLYNVNDSSYCNTSSNEERKNILCSQIKNNFNCRQTLARPIQISAQIQITSIESFDYSLTCSWSLNDSHIRVLLYSLFMLISIYEAKLILEKNTKEYSLGLSIVLWIFILISAYFDNMAKAYSGRENLEVCASNGMFRANDEMVCV